MQPDQHQDLPLEWMERIVPRKFGNVLPGDIEACRRAARDTGILLDPIYSLAAWETAQSMCAGVQVSEQERRVVMLHTGGALGLHGLAQRWPEQF